MREKRERETREREEREERERETQSRAALDAQHAGLRSEREDRSARAAGAARFTGGYYYTTAVVSRPCPWDTLATSSQLFLFLLQFYYILLYHPPSFFFLSHLSSPLLILEHPLPLLPLLLLSSQVFSSPAWLTFPPDSIPHNLVHRSPTPRSFLLLPVPPLIAAASPGSGGTHLVSLHGGIATWGARSRSENGLLSVSRRPAEPAGIGVVGARLRLFPTSPVLSGPVRYGSLCGGAGTARGAPAAAPVERDGGGLAQDHPRLISRHFTCGAAARLPFLPQRLPDADRLELLR